MSDKKYYWLKLKKDFFKRHDMQIIESMPNGKDYLLFYLKLLCESIDHEGNLRFSENIPYNEQMLATITNTNVDVVRQAIKIFSELGMMDVLDDGTYFMNEVNKLMGSETYWAERKRKQKLKIANEDMKYITVLSSELLRLPNGETRYVDNKRYGGNAFKVYERAKGVCEICGSSENLCIHHMNGYSNEMDDLIVVCRKCHRQIEVGNIDVGNIPIESNENPTSQAKSIEIEKDIDIDIDKDINKDIENKIIYLLSSSKNIYIGMKLENEFNETLKMMIKAGQVTKVIPEQGRLEDLMKEMIFDRQDVSNKQGYLIECFKHEG